MTDKILVERNGPVTTLIINRPKSKNALDNEAAHALADALHAFDADTNAHVAVLTGAVVLLVAAATRMRGIIIDHKDICKPQLSCILTRSR